MGPRFFSCLALVVSVAGGAAVALCIWGLGDLPFELARLVDERTDSSSLLATALIASHNAGVRWEAVAAALTASLLMLTLTLAYIAVAVGWFALRASAPLWPWLWGLVVAGANTPTVIRARRTLTVRRVALILIE